MEQTNRLDATSKRELSQRIAETLTLSGKPLKTIAGAVTEAAYSQIVGAVYTQVADALVEQAQEAADALLQRASGFGPDKDQVDALSDALSFTGKQLEGIAEWIIDRFLDHVAGELAAGNPVNLRSFGTFEPRMMDPVTRRRPDTGELVEKPAQRRVLFRASPLLKDRINSPTAGPAPESAPAGV